MDAADIDPNFEPQTRARSNTWPLRPNREVLDAQNSPVSEDSSTENHKEKDPLGLNTKKSGSRRNAWGNLSYADLITKAIQSSPEKRLTLSQIYDWMVQNVPYFKDKGDSTSSAGWKNSIRHNLSLHSRFMRIQNEGPGKSSWWVINPDAKPGKTPRRRAGSMETKNYEKKRGRVKKKVEALRAALEAGGSPSSTSEDFLDTLGFDFRPRASSNASSCGRLSPIQAVVEPDLHDNQVPPMSPIPWGSEIDSGNFGYPSDGFTDQLVDTLVDSMKLADQSSLSLAGSDNLDMVNNGIQEQFMQNGSNNDLSMSDFNQNSSYSQNGSYNGGQFTTLPAPPPYPDPIQRNSQSPVQQSSSQSIMNSLERVAISNSSRFNTMGLRPSLFGQQQDLYQQESGLSPDITAQMNTTGQLSINTQPQMTSPSRSPQQSSPIGFGNGFSPSVSPQSIPPQPRQLSPQSRQLSPQQTQSSPVNTAATQSRAILQQQQQQQLQTSSDSILRAALTQGPAMNYSLPTTTANHVQFPQMNMPYTNAQLNGPVSTTCNSVEGVDSSMDDVLAPQINPQLSNQRAQSGNFASEADVPIDIDVDNLIYGLDWDVDQIIKQELTLEGKLDFNFDGTPNIPSTINKNPV